MKKQRYRPGMKEPRQIPADVAALTAAILAAVVEAIRPIVKENPYRLLRTLSKEEAESIGWEATHAYVKKRAELEAAEQLNDRVDDIYA